MNRTNIEWCRSPDGSAGWSWNPITGCINHIDGFCKGGGFRCYAHRLAHGRLQSIYKKNMDTAPTNDVKYKPLVGYNTWSDPFYPRFWPERLRELDPIWKGKHFTVGGGSKVQPKGIFVCDMSDLFGIGIPEEWTRQVLEIIKFNPWHRFYLLTKQPQNLPQWSPFPDNCWVGVTITSEDMINPAYWALTEIDAKIKYLSIEPLLHWRTYAEGFNFRLDFVDWLIIGAQTKPYKPPKIEWVQEIVEAADKAGIPVFIKRNMNSENLPDNAFGKDGLVRREVPK